MHMQAASAGATGETIRIGGQTDISPLLSRGEGSKMRFWSSTHDQNPSTFVRHFLRHLALGFKSGFEEPGISRVHYLLESLSTWPFISLKTWNLNSQTWLPMSMQSGTKWIQIELLGDHPLLGNKAFRVDQGTIAILYVRELERSYMLRSSYFAPPPHEGRLQSYKLHLTIIVSQEEETD